MEEKALMFYVFAGVSVLFMLADLFATHFLKRSYLRFQSLLASGWEAKGKVLECKEFSNKGRKIFFVKYEFPTSTGNVETGKVGVPEKTTELTPGTPVTVLYMQNIPSINSLKDGLKERVDIMQKTNKILAFLPLHGVVALLIFWYILINNHIVQLPF